MCVQMTVMEECHRQIQDITGKQKEKVDELNAEIRKLKAMIGTSRLLSFCLIWSRISWKNYLTFHSYFFSFFFHLIIYHLHWCCFFLFPFLFFFLFQFVSFLFFPHFFFTIFFLFIFPSFFYSVVFSETRDTDPVAGNQKQGAGEAAHVPGTNKVPLYSEPVMRIRDVYPEFWNVPNSDFLPSGSRIPNLTRTKKEERGIFYFSYLFVALSFTNWKLFYCWKGSIDKEFKYS